MKTQSLKIAFILICLIYSNPLNAGCLAAIKNFAVSMTTRFAPTNIKKDIDRAFGPGASETTLKYEENLEGLKYVSPTRPDDMFENPRFYLRWGATLMQSIQMKKSLRIYYVSKASGQETFHDLSPQEMSDFIRRRLIGFSQWEAAIPKTPNHELSTLGSKFRAPIIFINGEEVFLEDVTVQPPQN